MLKSVKQKIGIDYYDLKSLCPQLLKAHNKIEFMRFQAKLLSTNEFKVSNYACNKIDKIFRGKKKSKDC